MYLCKTLILIRYGKEIQSNNKGSPNSGCDYRGDNLSHNRKAVYNKDRERSFLYDIYRFHGPQFFELKSDTAKNVLSIMCETAEFNTGIVDMGTSVRKSITDKLKISPNALTNAIRSLKELKLISGERDKFQLNAMIHWKGDIKSRDELINDKTFKVTFGYK